MAWGRRWTFKDLAGTQAGRGLGSKGGGNKFGAIPTQAPASWGGSRMADSKTGAALAHGLRLAQRLGQIIGWAEEVSIPIGPDESGKIVRYRADALVVVKHVTLEDGTPAMVVRLLDAKRKSMDTPTSRAKRAALRARGILVEVVDP